MTAVKQPGGVRAGSQKDLFWMTYFLEQSRGATAEEAARHAHAKTEFPALYHYGGDDRVPRPLRGRSTTGYTITIPTPP